MPRRPWCRSEESFRCSIRCRRLRALCGSSREHVGERKQSGFLAPLFGAQHRLRIWESVRNLLNSASARPRKIREARAATR